MNLLTLLTEETAQLDAGAPLSFGMLRIREFVAGQRRLNRKGGVESKSTPAGSVFLASVAFHQHRRHSTSDSNPDGGSRDDIGASGDVDDLSDADGDEVGSLATGGVRMAAPDTGLPPELDRRKRPKSLTLPPSRLIPVYGAWWRP